MDLHQGYSGKSPLAIPVLTRKPSDVDASRLGGGVAMDTHEPKKHHRGEVVKWVGYALSAGWLIFNFLKLFFG